MATVEDLHIWESFRATVRGLIDFVTEHISEIFFVIIILLLTIVIAKIIENRMTAYASTLQKGMRMDATKLSMLRHITVGIIYILGFILILYTIPELRALSSTILVSVGVLSLVIGMAAQDTFGNIISGIALVFFHPFRVGDLITVGTNYGRVTDVNLRQTTILTPDNRYILIPNSTLNKDVVINWTYQDTLVRWSCTIPISHNSSIDRAREIMLEEARKNPYVLSKEVLERKHVNFSADVRARVPMSRRSALSSCSISGSMTETTPFRLNTRFVKRSKKDSMTTRTFQHRFPITSFQEMKERISILTFK